MELLLEAPLLKTKHSAFNALILVWLRLHVLRVTRSITVLRATASCFSLPGILARSPAQGNLRLS